MKAVAAFAKPSPYGCDTSIVVAGLKDSTCR
jgi:hypothetical protein